MTGSTLAQAGAPRRVHVRLRAVRRSAILAALSTAPLCATAAHAQTATPPSAWGPLAPGPNPVGFSSWVERDASRMTDAHARAVQVSLWYPSTDRAVAPRLSIADYVALGATERGQPASDSSSATSVGQFVTFLASSGVPRADVMRWLASPMRARRDAAHLAHAIRPLILVAQGNGHAAYHQAVLCEYLASHGYTVVTTPSPLRLGATLAGDSDIFAVAADQAADLEVATRAAVRRGLADSAHVATVGHSFGARASLLVVLHRHASMLVSLDGGIANAQGRAWLDHAPVDLTHARGSLVHIFQEGDSIVVPDFGTVRRLTGMDRTLILADGLRHWGFTSFGTSAAAFPTVAPGPASANNARTSADVVIVTACVLDRWSRGIGRLDPTPCFEGKAALRSRERLPATGDRPTFNLRPGNAAR